MKKIILPLKVITLLISVSFEVKAQLDPGCSCECQCIVSRHTGNWSRTVKLGCKVDQKACEEGCQEYLKNKNYSSKYYISSQGCTNIE